MILSICLSPGLQRTVTIGALTLGEVNRLQSVVVDVAGKGVNACRVLQRLGLDAVCLGQGGDNGEEIFALARKEELNLRLVTAPGMLRTCTSIIEMSVDGGRRVTELVEPTAPVDAACVAAMDTAFAELLPNTDALIIAGSMAPGFPASYQTHLAEQAHARGISVAIDLQNAALRDAMRAEPALVKINLAEFAAAFLAPSFSGGEHSGVLAEKAVPPELRAAVADVSRRYPATTFVLTRGANSVLSASRGELHEYPVQPLPASETLSTIGCGDTFLAGLVAHLRTSCHLTGNPIPAAALAEAIDFASRCAKSSARTFSPGVLEATFSRFASQG